MTTAIIALEPQHWNEVKTIYEQGLATGIASFETKSPSWVDWDRSHLTVCRFVAIQRKKVVGWIALSPVSSRCVYGGVAEISVYVHEDYRKMGVGKLLLATTVAASEQKGYWTLQAGIMPQNISSIKLHEAAGFRVVGYREKISKINEQWTDNLLLERRSKVVGIQ